MVSADNRSIIPLTVQSYLAINGVLYSVLINLKSKIVYMFTCLIHNKFKVWGMRR
jgi:hypothetical protein